jgi:hypothetical protein
MTGRSAPWTTAALVTLCAALGAAVVFELTGGLPLAPEVTAAAPGAQLDWSRKPVEFEPPRRDEIDAIAARPLFSPSRQPFVAAEEEAEAAPIQTLPQVTLIGVLLTDKQRAALLQAVGQGDPSWVREGHEIQGWQVERIEQSRVHLRAGDQVERVELRPDTAVPNEARPKRRSARAEQRERSDETDPAAGPDEAQADSPEEEADSPEEEDSED